MDSTMATRRESCDRTSGRTISTAGPPNELALTEEEIEEKPWKYIGYRGYSEFISSENDFYILRGFRSLNTRIALAQQDQIAVLEQRLMELDTEYSRRDAEDLHNGSFRNDRDDRTELVDLIIEKLSLYSRSSSWNILLAWC
jgi:mannose-6-phosphate isomerase class I